jgi:hypothetical protein
VNLYLREFKKDPKTAYLAYTLEGIP